MFYSRGRIRHLNRCLLIRSLKNGIVIQVKNESTMPASKSNQNFFDNTKFLSKALKFIQVPNETKQELDIFARGDYKKFHKYCEYLVTNQRVLPTKTRYTSIKRLNDMMEENRVKRAIELVYGSFKQGIFLTDPEFQSLFVQLLPFKWYAYRLLTIYENRIDFKKFSSEALSLFMKTAHSNFDYRIFDKLFQLYQLKNDTLPVEIVMIAIQVYLKTENIEFARQIFHQQVMTESKLPNRILDLYISNLYNKTHNTNLCCAEYKLWLSRGLNTNISIDSFMHNLIYESGDQEEIEWIEKSLKDRGLYNKFAIQFGKKCNEISKNHSRYKEFFESGEVEAYLRLAKEEGETSLLNNNLTYLHLRHRNYKSAMHTFLEVDNRKDMQLSVFSILRHFEKEENPNMVFEILKNLKIGADYKIHWSHIIVYWRTMIKKYPHLAHHIHKNFKKSSKKSKYHRYGFLSKMLDIKLQASNSETFESRFYPTIKQAQLTSEFKPLPAAPKLQNIESRLKKGIIPNNELLRKSIKLTNKNTEFGRLVEIAYDVNKQRCKSSTSSLPSVRLNIAIFYKDFELKNVYGNKTIVEEFVLEQIELIKSMEFVDSEDLIQLFRMCVKHDLYSYSFDVLELFELYQVRITNNQQILKFLSMFIKWCWRNKHFEELVLTINWLETQENLATDKFFLSNLKEEAIKITNRLHEEVHNSTEENSSDEKNMTALENENAFLTEVLPRLFVYYNSKIDGIDEKNEVLNKQIILNSKECFDSLFRWVDHDTELMFEGEW